MSKKVIFFFVLLASTTTILELAFASFIKAHYIVSIVFPKLFFLAGLIFVLYFLNAKLKEKTRQLDEWLQKIEKGDHGHRFFATQGDELDVSISRTLSFVQKLKNGLVQQQKQSEIVKNVLNNIKEGVLLIDKSGKVLLHNKSIEKLFGPTPSSSDLRVIEILRDAGLLSLVEESKKVEKRLSREVLLKNGKYLDVVSSPFFLQDDQRGILMTFLDITRLKKLEQIRKDFVANVAHEIRTPITAISGFAETLMDGAIDDKDNAIKFLQIIKKHADRLNSLVSDLLTLSAMESGEVNVEISDVNLSEIIDSLFLLMEERAKAKGLYLKKFLPEDISIIKADRDKLFQILLNLVDNGIKFTEKGGVTVGAKRSGDTIVLFVEDTGCGIDKKHIPRLGERFYRVDKARSRELGGTGLGLAIVKHLVKLHGWSMNIESSPGKGTIVNIIVTDRNHPQNGTV